MEAPARQSVLGTYDYVAVGIYYVIVLTVSIYVSSYFTKFVLHVSSVEAIVVLR
jgi:hypothetical protein